MRSREETLIPFKFSVLYFILATLMRPRLNCRKTKIKITVNNSISQTIGKKDLSVLFGNKKAKYLAVS